MSRHGQYDALRECFDNLTEFVKGAYDKAIFDAIVLMSEGELKDLKRHGIESERFVAYEKPPEAIQ